MREVCTEMGIKMEKLSYDWILQLTKGDKVRHITGTRFDINGEASGDIACDKYATYEVLKAQLDRYPELENDITFLSKFSSYNNNVDFAGRMIYNDKGQEVFNFGKYKGRLVEEILKVDPGYYSWIMNGEFPLNTKQILSRIRLRDFNSKI